MATTMTENGLEVPGAPLAAGAGLSRPHNVPSLSMSAVHSAHTSAATIPNFDDPGYEAWVLNRIVAARMVEYEAKIGKLHKGFWRKSLITVLKTVVADELAEKDAHHLDWWGAREKKTVSFFKDVPFKHSARTGEVFEGPVSSQLTFEKESGENATVFVNPERTG